MTTAQIHNPSQAYSLGATWGTPSVDNTMSQQVGWFINSTAQTLYTSDVVCLDVTGTAVAVPTTATLNLAIGCVGTPAGSSTIQGTWSAGVYTAPTSPVTDTQIGAQTTIGDNQPDPLIATSTPLIGFTNGSSAITSALVSTANPIVVGMLLITPYNSSTNANPQIFQVTVAGGSSGSWTGTVTGYAGGAATFSGTTGSFTCSEVLLPGNLNYGWNNAAGWTNTSAFATNQIVPVVMKGYGRVNIDNTTGSAAVGDLMYPVNAQVYTNRVAIGGFTIALGGSFIAQALEAGAAYDASILNNLGVAGHRSIRGLIGKM